MKRFLKAAYKRIPFKKPLFSLVKKFGCPSENIYKHLYFEGNFRVQVDDSHSFLIRHYGFELENLVFWAGLQNGWEKTSISLWTKLSRQSEVIFDIGANTGIYSLISKSVNPNSKVYAFEPIERVFQKLEHNVQLNGYDISCFDCALSNTDGKALVYDPMEEHVYSVTVNKDTTPAETTVFPTEIEVMRLDTFVREKTIEKIDLIKLDVETHESEVLEGFGEYLEKFKPTLLIEILNDEVGQKVEKLVEGKNYLYFNLDEASNSIRKVERITRSDYYNYLICSQKVAEQIGLLN